jgi:predicted benzoate:H+ symporter BenE
LKDALKIDIVNTVTPATGIRGLPRAPFFLRTVFLSCLIFNNIIHTQNPMAKIYRCYTNSHNYPTKKLGAKIIADNIKNIAAITPNDAITIIVSKGSLLIRLSPT